MSIVVILQGQRGTEFEAGFPFFRPGRIKDELSLARAVKEIFRSQFPNLRATPRTETIFIA
jgi:hypothetical protein